MYCSHADGAVRKSRAIFFTAISCRQLIFVLHPRAW